MRLLAALSVFIYYNLLEIFELSVYFYIFCHNEFTYSTESVYHTFNQQLCECADSHVNYLNRFLLAARSSQCTHTVFLLPKHKKWKGFWQWYLCEDMCVLMFCVRPSPRHIHIVWSTWTRTLLCIQACLCVFASQTVCQHNKWPTN